MSRKLSGWKEYAAVVGLILVAGSVVAFWQAEIFVQQTCIKRPSPCARNLMQIGVAMEMYASAWGDRRPPLYTTDQRAPQGKAWPDLLMPYMKKLDPAAESKVLVKRFRCPYSTGDRLTYSLNRKIDALEMRSAKHPSTTIAVFESVCDSPKNNNLNGDTVFHPSAGRLPSTGTLVIWPSKYEIHYRGWPEWARMRHNGTNNVLYADGHVSTPESDQQPDFDPVKREEE